MNKSRVFIKRNIKECLRDPVTYVFCIAFPVVMLTLFAVINSSVPEKQVVFGYTSLIPGVIVFGFSFVSLSLCLLVSKDCKTAFLRRLYASPLKSADFVTGALHSVPDAAGVFAPYAFDTSVCFGFLTLGVYAVLLAAACFFAFSERK